MSSTSDKRTPVMEILIHLLLAPTSNGTFTWQLPHDRQMKLANDLRWTVLRKIFPELSGKSPYKALLQKHAIRVESLDREFFMEILEIIRNRHAKSFSLNEARDLSELELIEAYIVPTILEWAECERSVSVSRERTPSIEDLVTHEDSSGNIYHRFPDEFAWVINKDTPGREEDEKRVLPDEMLEFVHGVASELTAHLSKLLEDKKYAKYILLLARLEDNICTWEMTFDYLNELGLNRYSSWKSLSVVANRALKDFVDGLSESVKSALHQNDPDLTKEEKHDRLRLAVTAALELNPLPTPSEILAGVG